MAATGKEPAGGAAGTPKHDDFATAGWFVVKLQDALGDESYFREVKGLDINIDVETYDEGGKNDGQHKFPSPAKFSNIILKRGVTKSTKFIDWITSAVNRKYKRATGTISLRRRDGKPVMEWQFINAWPTRYAGPTLDAVTHDLAFEEIEIAHEGLSLQGGGGGGGAGPNPA